MLKCLFDKLKDAVSKDPDILTAKEGLEKTLGSDPRWLSELGLEKRDLKKLEKLGFAVKARYETKNKRGRMVGEYAVTGPHRIRWVIFKEVENEYTK